MNRKPLIIIVAGVSVVLIGITVSVWLGIHEVVNAPPTPEQTEYVELYKKLSEDEVLTEAEMEQLEDVFKKAYPNGNFISD